MLPLVFDFDGVIHDYKHPVKGRRMGGPMPGAIEALTELHERGFTLVCFTMRGGRGWQHVKDWLDFYGAPEMHVTDTKPDAAVYVDDKAIHHTEWGNTLGQIYLRLGVEPD